MSENRYSRQILFPPIGEAGQEKISRAAVVVIGCGALGTAAANNLCRAGVGRIRIVDRDFVDLTNLQRQALFTETDARDRLPKAVAAARRLGEINSTVAVEPVVGDANPRNIESFLDRAALALDATDNFETRFLLNDACVKLGLPWVYGGAVGASGMVMAILPGESACLRCALEEMPSPGTMPTCDRAGILNSTTGAVAALQTAAALRLLVGDREGVGALIQLDVWAGRFRTTSIPRRADCPACVRRSLEFLDGRALSWTTSLCGRNMVQIQPPADRSLSLPELAKSLRSAGAVTLNDYLLTLDLGAHELIIFPTGRVLVRGTTDVAVARSLVARYLG